MKRNRLKKSLIIYCLAALSIALLGVLKSATQEVSFSQDEKGMNSHFEPQNSEPQNSEQLQSSPSNYQRPIVQFKAEEFTFQSRVDSSSSSIDLERYTESVTASNGTLDLTLIDQGDAVTYLLQISSISNPSCEPDGARACQAAPGRGNVAEVQLTLPSGRLSTGVYSFSEQTSASGNEAIVYSRQLYSDPAHGQLGCQQWGRGMLNVERAVYDANGNLEYLDASVMRECRQTTALPPVLPQDGMPQTEIENITSYTYHAAWRSRYIPAL